MRQLLIYIFIFQGYSAIYSQIVVKDKVRYDYGGLSRLGDSTKLIWVYTSLNAASKVNPDSVKGLDLMSCGFKDFPKEILKYKNLIVLNIDAYNWSDVPDSLTVKQKKYFEKVKKNNTSLLPIDFFWKPSTIKKWPKEIKELKNLKYLCLGGGVRAKNKRKFLKIYEYLPNTSIYSELGDREDIKHQANIDSYELYYKMEKELLEKSNKK